jgi:hypothetical protein
MEGFTLIGANLSNVYEGPAIARQMKVQTVVDAVTRPIGRREYVHVGSAAAIPAADACRSSNRTLLGTGVVFHKAANAP